LVTNVNQLFSGWIPNHDLVDLDFDEVGNVSTTMRKDLAAAHQLAAEKRDLEYFKEILKNFMEAREAERAAKEAAKAEKKAKKAAAKKEKKTPKIIEDGDDEDVDMADAPGEVDSEAPAMTEVEEVKTKKRKSTATSDDVSYPFPTFQINTEFAETPQRDSVKKPRPNIKLTTTPKATNGTSTPKSAKEHSTTKSTKPKTKKSAPKTAETPEVVVPKEPELTAEEKRAKKEVSCCNS
jgi:hypothetical protein